MSEKILIVDDDIDSLKLISLMLQRHGYDVVAASAGIQALSKASSDYPDLIILDIMMPDMDGYEVCRRLRADEHTRNIPVIMFTAKILVDDKVAGFEAGADDYLTKPIHPAELASRVKAILARSNNQKNNNSHRGKTIGVIGAKGGVGTTTLALNIAAANIVNQESTIVADFCLGSGSMGIMLGADNSHGMANVLSRPANEITPATLQNEMIVHRSGLQALLSSANPREAQLKFPIESAFAVINGLRSLAQYSIFDLGNLYDDITSRLLREMDQFILVVEPFTPALKLGRNLIQELESNQISKQIHIVVVSRTQSTAQTPWSEVERILGRDVQAIISAAPDIAFQSDEEAIPLVLNYPNSIVSNQIMTLTKDINEQQR